MLLSQPMSIKEILATFNHHTSRVMKDNCEWVRAFDGNFNISCVGEYGKRANGQFKGDNAKWDFKYCPYCAGEIILTTPTP